MELAKKSLEIKRALLEDYTDKDLYPYTKFYLRDIKALLWYLLEKPFFNNWAYWYE